jgi:hypothetical protein
MAKELNIGDLCGCNPRTVIGRIVRRSETGWWVEYLFATHGDIVIPGRLMDLVAWYVRDELEADLYPLSASADEGYRRPLDRAMERIDSGDWQWYLGYRSRLTYQ